MATVCTKCGQNLPKENARFCNHCGTLVPSHPFSAQSLAASGPAASVAERVPTKPAPREQIAQQPVEKPRLREQMAQQPRPRTTRRIAPDDLAASAVAWPAPMTHVSVKELSPRKEDVQGQEAAKEQKDQAVQPTPPRPAFGERELRVKVWEQPSTLTPLPVTSNENEARAIEDTPTSALTIPESTQPEDVQEAEHGEDRAEMHTQVYPESRDTSKRADDVEYLDTVPVPSYIQPQTPQPTLLTQHPEDTPLPVAQKRLQSHTPAPDAARIQPLARGAQVAQPPQQLNRPVPQQMNASYVQEKYTPPSVLAPMPQPRKKSRIPLILLVVALLILVLGGSFWVVFAQPFAIPAVTQPLQDFKDTQLGVGLTYPSSWNAKHDATGVLFSDSTHTAQVKLTSATVSGDAAQYAQQQATKSGMTAIKSLGTLTFGGATWQQVQGNTQQDGVNYATTMLVTVHGNRTYVLTQMAPQNVYADEESVVFSPIRASLKFL